MGSGQSYRQLEMMTNKNKIVDTPQTILKNIEYGVKKAQEYPQEKTEFGVYQAIHWEHLFNQTDIIGRISAGTSLKIRAFF
ncbi:MAG: hypothetical protein P8Q37_08305 [Porticoccaceae bacterium]|nr:hypothetical protein [Porticoccaceae bacterium]MDG1474893.1 hypothetical protein [Porticoccaceae bacterium]